MGLGVCGRLMFVHAVLDLLELRSLVALILEIRLSRYLFLAAKSCKSELPRVPRLVGILVVGATVGGESSSLQQDGLKTT